MRKIRSSQIPSVWSKTGFPFEIRRGRDRSEGRSCHRRAARKGTRGATNHHRTDNEPDELLFAADVGSNKPESAMFACLALAGATAILLAFTALSSDGQSIRPVTSPLAPFVEGEDLSPKITPTINAQQNLSILKS